MKDTIITILILVLTLFVLIILYLLFIRFDFIYENISPVVKNQKTVGFHSDVIIGNKIHDNQLYIYSDILNKISMYQNTKQFIISFQINNYSGYSYLLKRVLVVDRKTKSIVYDIPYQVSDGNNFSFLLSDIKLSKKYYNYTIQIELVK